MTVICPECSTEYEDGTLFCDQDGTELPQPGVGGAEEEDRIGPMPQSEISEHEIGSQSELGEIEEPSTPASMPDIAGKAKLIVTRGAQLGVEYPLIQGENEIGRWDDDEGYSPHIDLDSQDMEGYVHRRHAKISYDGNQWWLEHLQEPPSNPTRIRNRTDALEVGEPVALQHGDELIVGRVILRFELP